MTRGADPAPDDFAARLASIHDRLSHPPGVMLGVLRLPILDPILDELEAAAAGAPLPEETTGELARLAELLSREMLGTATETVPRRGRIVELLRIADRGRLPPIAADEQDPFGAELCSMLESDDGLRASLGTLHPLLLRATSVAPTGRWLRDARDLAGGPMGPQLEGATRRTLAALARAPIESRPDILVGGVRPVNQRLARGLLWYAAATLAEPAETLRIVGLRMGTSGRSDAVVRDVALANTCAALLGASDDPGADAALVSMHRTVTNRNVLKQVGRALESAAARRGMTVDDLVDESLPAFGLDAAGLRRLQAGGTPAVIAVGDDGHVAVRWHGPDGGVTSTPPTEVATDDPAAVTEIASTAAMIEAALSEERAALEARLGSVRSWPVPVLRRRFLEHPLAGVFARRVVWATSGGGPTRSLLATSEGWVGPDDRPIADVSTDARLRPWHPAESNDAEIATWRATLAVRGVRQPFAQVDREVFLPAVESAAEQADVRFAGRIVDHARLRVLLRERRWAVPALGAWDQGDEATGWRAFDDGLRAELRYQAPERVPTGERIERARIIAIRFVRTDASPAGPATDPASVLVTEVPPRVFSEALRDVSLAVVVGELPAA